jgi:molecular chaperone GrpE (heat shock protein)
MTDESQIVPSDYTIQLREWMQRVGLSSFRSLSQAAGVSEKQIRQLRRGHLAQMRLGTVLKLSQVLQISPGELLGVMARERGKAEVQSPKAEDNRQTADANRQLEQLQQEYNRLAAQLTGQRQVLWQEFQQSSLQILESLLLQLPTAAYAAQQNPQAPAVKLLPLLRPLDLLLQEWGIEAIAPVGSEVPYNPQWHQLMEGEATVGDPVKIRYSGYRQGENLLYRAKVSPVRP